MDHGPSLSAWMESEHVSNFAGWNRLSTSRLVKICSRFNECRLLMTLVDDPDCQTLTEVGCAAGGFYRFFRKTWPELKYRGFDVSPGAIETARRVHLEGDFRVLEGDLISAPGITADILFCRDVVHHQDDPFGFLSSLYDAAGKYLVLRIRTREVGPTVLDASQSCQRVYGHWVPYIVINTSELVDLTQAFQPPPTRVVMRKRPTILGGHNNRFLPKELYYPETETAETAILIQKGTGQQDTDTVVTINTCPETRGSDRPYLTQWLRRIALRWGL